jgi:succinoglycan biosynthesis protein ExoU
MDCDRLCTLSDTKPARAAESGSVDVLIAARDRADTIQRAVLSALSQNEVGTTIVVDDGSKDDTAAKAQQCDPEGKRVIVERWSSSLGPSAARNKALSLCTAPWIAILDSDDYFLPGRITALLSKADDCDFIADDLVQMHDDQNPVRQSVLFGSRLEPFILGFEEFILGNIQPHGVLRRELGFLKPMIRRPSFTNPPGHVPSRAARMRGRSR